MPGAGGAEGAVGLWLWQDAQRYSWRIPPAPAEPLGLASGKLVDLISLGKSQGKFKENFALFL